KLQDSADETIAAIAAKALKGVEYHVDHSNQWLLRLGLGTEQSHRRISAGIYYMWPYLEELFEDLELHTQLAEDSIAVLPSSLREEALGRITEVLEKSNVETPQVTPARSNQRTGRFSEHRGYILAEMQSLARQHPGATW